MVIEVIKAVWWGRTCVAAPYSCPRGTIAEPFNPPRVIAVSGNLWKPCLSAWSSLGVPGEVTVSVHSMKHHVFLRC